jgi:hypothetical protein
VARQDIVAATPTIIYSTGFETNQGFNGGSDLEGQQGWVGTGLGSQGDNGLTSCCTPGQGQAAYIGFAPLLAPQDSLFVWHPVNVSPLASNTPIVKFSVAMKIVDSTFDNFDSFRWTVFNADGKELFTLDFENSDLRILYHLENRANFIFTGYKFTNDVLYSLVVTMDLAANLWGATLDNITLVANVPITTTNTPLTLGDIDAVWLYSNPLLPGDNFMVFDNYRITAEPAPPRLRPVVSPGNPFSVLLTADPNKRYALEANTNLANLLGWVSLQTNTTALDGTTLFVDSASPGIPTRFYRARLAQ